MELSADSLADNKLLLLEGWAPAASVGQIQEYLNTSNAYYEIADPTPDDDVPILLANNKFARLFEPIMRLYMCPNTENWI